MIHPDFQYDPSYVPHMLKPILNKEADFVLGSRFLESDPRKEGMVWWRYWGNRVLTTLQNVILKTKLSEAHSGYRCYSRQMLKKIPYYQFSDSFVFDSQMLKMAAKHKVRIMEIAIPTRYTNESSSISFIASVRYGFETLMTLF